MEILFIYIIAVVIMYIVHIPIHELGHLFFGYLSGYRFNTFRLLSFVWYKDGGRVRFTRSKGVVLGQCLMDPPADEKDFKFVLYNLGGGLFNYAFGILTIILAYIIVFDNPENRLLFMVLLTIGITGIFLAMANLIPMKPGGIPNDGCNIAAASKSKEAARGFFTMLSVNSEFTQGKTFADFEEGRFAVDDFADFDNYFVAYTLICEASRLFDTGEYERSFEQYKRLNPEALPAYYRCGIKADMITYYILFENNYEKARLMYKDDKALRKFLNYKTPTIRKVLSLYEFYVNGDKAKGKKLLDETVKAAEIFPNPGIKKMVLDSCAMIAARYAEGDNLNG